MSHFTATWLGDGDPQSQFITYAGIDFIKGKATKVPEALSDEHGTNWAAAIKGNPTFAVGSDDDEVVDAGEDEERKALMADLDALGVTYKANAKIETLRDALAKAMA